MEGNKNSGSIKVGEGNNETPEIFFNYLVLKKVFQNLDHENLKLLRSTCTLWNSIAFPILFSRSVALLNDSDKLFQYAQQYGIQQKSSICTISSLKICDINFTEDNLFNFSLILNSPVTDLLVSFEIDFAPSKGNSILTSLFNLKVFPILEKLKIRILKFYEVKNHENPGLLDDSKSGNNIQSNFPKLKSFTYAYYSFDGSEYTFPIKWENLLEQFYNLQELLFTGISSLELHEVLDALWILRLKHSGKYNIQKFQVLSEDFLPETPNDDHLNKLIQISLPLKSLAFEISPTINENLLQTILTHHKATLETLQLRKFPLKDSNIQENIELFQTIFNNGLTNVTNLDISDHFLTSLDFLMYLPNLSSLIISNRNPSKLSHTKMFRNTSLLYLQPQYNLKSLTIDENITTNCFKKICTLFPTLEYLKLRMDDEMLRICYEYLTQLRTLHIIGKVAVDDENEDEEEEDYNEDDNEVFTSTNNTFDKNTCTDKGITGIPLRFMVWGNFGMGDRDIIKKRMFPYIGYLTMLENLVIESWGNYGIGITNYCIYYGLVELTRLKKVKFVGTLITEEGIDLLEEKGVHVIALE